MHSIKTDVSIQGTTTVQQDMKVQGNAVIDNNITATGDASFTNATFTKVDVGQDISASTIAISGNINVDGDLIGSDNTEATFNKVNTEDISTTKISTTDLTSTGTISSDHIINSNKINTKDLVSTVSVTSNKINTTDLVSTGTITSDTMINSNVINTKDLSSTGSISSQTIQTKDLSSTGTITSDTITNTNGIKTKDVVSTGTITSNVTTASEVHAVNLTSTGTINSDTINNNNSIITKDVSSSGVISSNTIESNVINNTNGINTSSLVSTGVITTNSLNSTESIKTKNITSTGMVSASNITTDQAIITKDLHSSGVINSQVINSTRMINAKDVISTGTLTTKDIQSDTITTTGSITTGNIVSSGTITTAEINVNTINSTDLVISGNIMTVGESSTDAVNTNFLTLGDTLNAAFINNVTWVNTTNGMSLSPVLQKLSNDGTVAGLPMSKIYSEMDNLEVNGSVGPNTVDFEGKYDTSSNSAVFSITAVPAEDYTGEIRILVANEATDTSLIDYKVPNVSMTSGESYEFQFDCPLWSNETDTMHYQVLDSDGIPVKVLSNNGQKPYISLKYRNFDEYQVLTTNDISVIAESLRNLPQNERLDVLSLNNVDQLMNGTFMGSINFGAGVSQFNNAVRNSYWKAETAGVLDGISFNIGDKIVCTRTTGTVTTINSTDYFSIETNINPLATSTVAGTIIPHNGLNVDSQGKVSVSIGTGLAFDNTFNITADVANIDVTKLKNFNTLQKGSFRGILPNTLTALAGSVRGDFWKANASGKIGSQTYNAGDELFCNTDTPSTPTNLNNFTLIPQATAIMVGSTLTSPGIAGNVPSPKAGDNNKAFFGDGTYKSVITPLDVVDTIGSTSGVLPLSANQGTLLNDLIATKASTSDIVDNLSDNSANKPLSANQGRILAGLIANKSNSDDIVDNLNSTSTSVPLSANQGRVLSSNIQLKLNSTDVVDSLLNTSPSKALSANQGYIIGNLLDQKIGTSSIVDNLTSTSGSSVLSANQGYILSSMVGTKLNISDVVDNLIDVSTNKALSAHQGNVLNGLISTKVSTSDIVDNLLSSNSTVPLSAKQGKILQASINTKINTADIVDSLTSTSTVAPLSANQGSVINTALSNKVNISDVTDNLTSISISAPLSANQGRILNNQVQAKLNVSDIIDSVTLTTTNQALSANQGKVLNDKIGTKINTADIVDSLTSTSIIFPLSARQGTVLNTLIGTKVNTSDIIDSLTSTNPNKPLSANQGAVISVILSNKVNISDIVDNLTTVSSSRPLSANQGVILSSQIDTKQSTLISGTNIKSINGTSLLGSGNIVTNVPATTTTSGNITLSGDLSGTATAPVVSRINGISVSGSPVAGHILIANGTNTAIWQPQTAMYNANSTTSGLMSAADKSKLDTFSGTFTGSTSSAAGSIGLVPAPSIADSHNHMLKANGTWGGVNNAARVSCYNTVNKASLLAFGPMTANSAMTVTGNTSLYTGNTTGVSVAVAGLYKVTCTAMITAGLINGGHQFGVGLGAGTSISGAAYRIDALSVNTISNVSFCEIVSVAAGQNICCSYMSSSILNTYQGFTMVVEKLD
ncbi:hypothetical protein XaC1_301 [Xanthomonas phage XaC1]|nr:hypothetical protein XaC1_301 [Xanthomonas phage XaC1]